jgi:hypothetical protein
MKTPTREPARSRTTTRVVAARLSPAERIPALAALLGSLLVLLVLLILGSTGAL